MKTEKKNLARELTLISRLEGNFILRNGQESNYYFDKYRFETNPNLLKRVAISLAEMIPQGTEKVAGGELGGIPLVTALSLETGLESIFVRKRKKEYGTQQLIEGGTVDRKMVAFVEDIVTSGASSIEFVSTLREAGAQVEDVLCVIFRGDNSVLERFNENKINLIHLFHYNEGLNDFV